MSKHLYKKDGGNLVQVNAETDHEEEMHRAGGFQEIHELFPPPVEVSDDLPSADDLDAVADEQTAAEETEPTKPRASRRKRGRKATEPVAESTDNA